MNDSIPSLFNDDMNASARPFLRDDIDAAITDLFAKLSDQWQRVGSETLSHAARQACMLFCRSGAAFVRFSGRATADRESVLFVATASGPWRPADVAIAVARVQREWGSNPVTVQCLMDDLEMRLSADGREQQRDWGGPSRWIVAARLATWNAPCRVSIVELEPVEKTAGRSAAMHAQNPRDKWIYEQAAAGVAYSAIRVRLKRDYPEWELLDTEQGVRQCAKRYALRHELPTPGRRKRGRPSAKN